MAILRSNGSKQLLLLVLARDKMLLETKGEAGSNMSAAAGLLYKIRLVTNLSILVWVSILNTVGRRVRNGLLSLLLRIAPGVRTETGLLVSTYELMRERLRDSLQEIEQKGRQLEESWEQLRKSRDLLQTTIDSLDEELIVLDRQLRITQANRNVRLKYKDQEVVGRYCYEVTHGLSHPCRSPCICPASRVWQTETPARVIHVHRVNQNGPSKDRYVEVNASPLFDKSGKITQVVELSRDITESKEQENQILEANRYLLALNAIAATVSQTLNLEFILNSALDKTLELIKAEAGGIFLLDEKSQTLSYRVYRGLSEQFIKRTANLALGEGIAGTVAMQGKTMVVDDISKDPRVSRQLAVVEEELKAFVCVPLMSKEKVVGVLNIASREPRAFSQQEVQLLTAIGHELGIAVENARLYQELQLKEEMRTELLRRIISAQEDERRRLARELHDVTSQDLATLAVRLEALATAAGSRSNNMDTQLEAVKSLLAATSKEVHRLVYGLRPSLLDDLGLPAALRSCAHGSLDAAGVEVHFEVAGEEKRLPPQVEIALFRIAQEAITNIARHARAESAYISLEFKEKSVFIQVEDDGIGFDLSQVCGSAGTGKGMGLLSMKERAELLGGTLTIDTKLGGGTRVAAEVPTDWGQGDV